MFARDRYLPALFNGFYSRLIRAHRQGLACCREAHVQGTQPAVTLPPQGGNSSSPASPCSLGRRGSCWHLVAIMEGCRLRERSTVLFALCHLWTAATRAADTGRVPLSLIDLQMMSFLFNNSNYTRPCLLLSLVRCGPQSHWKPPCCEAGLYFAHDTHRDGGRFL